MVLRETITTPTLVRGMTAAAHILRDRYGDTTAESDSADPLFDFQRDAVLRARAILARRGGVLIADSVGLGKTHVAAELLAPALAAGARVALVGPAGLAGHWRDALPAADLEWMSYARLSRRSLPHGRRDVVVFDEAHALRNPATQRYRQALALARDAQVILLTATPVNNSIWDLYHLLRLFAGDRDFADVGVPSLRAAFDEAGAAVLLGAAPSILPVLRAVLIRRTRSLLRVSREARLRFPAQRPPVPVYYGFARREGTDVLEVAGTALLELEFPAHHDRGPAPAELMRRSLFKRLESSVHALHCSIDRYDALLAQCSRALDRGLMPEVRPGGPPDVDQLSFDQLLHRPIRDRARAGRMRDGIERERHLIEQARDALGGTDAKLAALMQLLARDLRGERVVVFTQFRDTARYLHAALARNFRVGLIDGGGARLGNAPAERLEVVRRFAPRANRAPVPRSYEAVDVLIATDVLSEGFNLQDASVVVSYDLPWNPVRLVQRIGRIDRLGSDHAAIGTYHFLPGDLDRYLGLLDRIAAKTSAIDATVGAEMPALHAALARALDRRDPTFLAQVEEESDPFILDARLRALQRQLPPLPASEGFVYATLPARERAGSLAMVAARVGPRVEWLAVSADGAVRDERLCAELLGEAGTQESPGADLPEDVLQSVLNAARTGIARQEATIATAPLLPPGGVAARVGRRLLELAAATPGGADARLCSRVEHALERLASAPDALLAATVPASDGAARDLPGLLEILEALPVPDVVAPSSSRPVRLIAAIVRAPASVDAIPGPR